MGVDHPVFHVVLTDEMGFIGCLYPLYIIFLYIMITAWVHHFRRVHHVHQCQYQYQGIGNSKVELGWGFIDVFLCIYAQRWRERLSSLYSKDISQLHTSSNHKIELGVEIYTNGRHQFPSQLHDHR